MLFNRARAVEYMLRGGLDALIATSPVNVTYFADYVCWLDPLFKEYMVTPGASSQLAQTTFAVFPLEGEPVLIVNALMAVNAADLWVREVEVYGDGGFDYALPQQAAPDSLRRFYDLPRAARSNLSAIQVLVNALNAHGLADARLGVEMEGLPAQSQEQITRALPRAALKDCTNLIRLVRAVKSQEEIARLARSAEINEQAALASFALAQPGRTWDELTRSYRARAGELGAALDHFAFSPHGLGIATAPAYTLSADDVLWVDFGCIYQGYFSDSGTTLALREFSPALKDRYAAIHECMDAGVDAIRGGVKASAVQRAMSQTLNAHAPVVSYPHGHSLGLEVRDYPILAPANDLRIRDDCIDVSSDLELEADMVINLEAPIYMPSVGALHIEQTFVVTANGCRLLVPQDRTLPLVGA